MRIFTGLAISAILAAAPLSVGAETMIGDPITGCQIWSDAPPGTDEVATWTGDCDGGKASGTGVLVWVEDGKLLGRYAGAMAGGKFNGDGELIIRAQNGKGFDKISGKFADGAPHGEIVAEMATGEKYQGIAEKGELHGVGAYSDGAGNTYEGEFKDSLPHGVGYYEAKDGEAYFGDFENGSRHGRGVLIGGDGDFYMGVFAKGKAHGFGRVETGDGGLYEGQFADGIPHGGGMYTAADGTRYQGQFVKGDLTGAVLVMRDGKQSVENWKDGAPVK